MYYHASQVANIKVLEPRVSNHNTPLIYFSTKRENVLVYLSNAIEKYCKETGFSYDGKWYKWASYGFDTDGVLRIDEYYPNALQDTYQGVAGYIYQADTVCENENNINISNAVTSSGPVTVSGVEIIEDAYSEIWKAHEAGLIRIRKYEDMSDGMLSWIETTMREEYEKAKDYPDYRHFLRGKFRFLSSDS